MHLAFVTETDNPLAKVTDKVYNYIAARQKTSMCDLVTDFWKSLPQGKKSMEDILGHLISTGKIEETSDKTTGKIDGYKTI